MQKIAHIYGRDFTALSEIAMLTKTFGRSFTLQRLNVQPRRRADPDYVL